MLKLATAASLIVCAGLANAGVYCTEEVTSLILHKNGNVYFKTTKTCTTGWCSINWPNEADKNRAFSSMLSAKLSKSKTTFYWPNISNCETVNATYSSPDTVAI